MHRFNVFCQNLFILVILLSSLVAAVVVDKKVLETRQATLPPALQAAVATGNARGITQAISTLSGGDYTRVGSLSASVASAAEKLLSTNPNNAIQACVGAINSVNSVAIIASTPQTVTQVVTTCSRIVINPSAIAITPNGATDLASTLLTVANTINSPSLIANTAQTAISLAEKVVLTATSNVVPLAIKSLQAFTLAVANAAPTNALTVANVASRIMALPTIISGNPVGIATMTNLASQMVVNPVVYSVSPTAAVSVLTACWTAINVPSVVSIAPSMVVTVRGILSAAATSTRLNIINPTNASQIASILAMKFTTSTTNAVTSTKTGTSVTKVTTTISTTGPSCQVTFTATQKNIPTAGLVNPNPAGCTASTGSTCPLQRSFLDGFNAARANATMLGKYKGTKYAPKPLKWSCYLEQTAARYAVMLANACVFAHSASGQQNRWNNVSLGGWQGTVGESLRIATVSSTNKLAWFSDLIPSWNQAHATAYALQGFIYDEYPRFTDPNNATSCSPKWGGNTAQGQFYCGHFSTAMSSITEYVGCAMAESFCPQMFDGSGKPFSTDYFKTNVRAQFTVCHFRRPMCSVEKLGNFDWPNVGGKGTTACAEAQKYSTVPS